MRIKHFVSWFLIVFGIIGYVTTVPIAYFSNYTIISAPSILEEVDKKLHNIMIAIHEQCVKYGKEGKYIDYVKGANIGGFVKVADAMLEQGLV